MKVYFVRVAHNRVSVGMFACRKRDLPMFVDQFVDPDACEYRRLPSGGFMFGGEVDLSREPDGEGDDYLSAAFNDIGITESWGRELAGSDEEACSDWKSLHNLARLQA